MNRKQRRATQFVGTAPSPAAAAERFADRGREHHRENRLAEAIDCFRKALHLDPSSIDAQMNLGVALAQMGCQREAAVQLRRARTMCPREPMVQRNAGVMLLQLGRWDEATSALETAIALAPNEPTAYENLALVLTENGRRDAALPLAKRAIALAPRSASAHFRLHSVLYDERDLTPSAKALKQAVALDPANTWYRLCLGILLDQTGDPKGARREFDAVNADGATHVGAIESWEYVKSKRGPSTRFLATTRDALLFGLERAGVDGLVLEFGVRYGVSTRWIASETRGTVHGFDSFKGLPEAWHIQPKGVYSTHDELPEVPSNVELHVGWFDATLPPFAATHPGPVRFMNVDCDIYSGTKTIFDELGDRVVPGSVLVFDEYIINDAWREDEFRGFQEAVAARGWRYEYLAFSVENCQAVVRIL